MTADEGAELRIAVKQFEALAEKLDRLIELTERLLTELEKRRHRRERDYD